MEHSEVILTLEEIQVQFRHLHWQTKSFSQHKAYGMIYEDLNEHIDMFVEVCMGKHGRPDFIGGYQLAGKDITELEIDSFINKVCEFLISLTDVYDDKTDSDLLNIRDEMLALFNKLKYLLTLE